MSFNPIILIEGDPRGVFLELFFKSIRSESFKSKIVLICCKKNLEQQMKKLGFKRNINLLNKENITKALFKKNEINLIDVKFEKSNNINLNKTKIKQYIEKCFSISFEIIKKKTSNKLINGPVDKNIFLNKKYLGVTEYISKKFKIRKTGMLIFNKKLSVCPVTTHLPIKLVAKKISIKIIKEKIILINSFYLRNFNFKPRIAVVGLNPHCETILKFDEDKKIITPAIKAIKNKKINVKGPFSADTIFSEKNRKEYDVIVGMYHDQVLAPIKTLFEFDAINITMGLPFLRVTPDHGPNKKMFGKNNSNPKSLINALKFLDQHD